MSSAILAKATDKIINQMTPEELARYVNRLCNQQAKDIYLGKTTHEESDADIKTMIRKHVNKLNVVDYIKYLKELYTDDHIIMFRFLAEEYLQNINLRLSLVEMCIMYHIADDACFLCDGDQTSNEKTRRLVEPFFRLLEDIKKERDEYVSHPDWDRYGGVPEVKGRESLLPPGIVEL
jgi:hypothetical protein